MSFSLLLFQTHSNLTVIKTTIPFQFAKNYSSKSFTNELDLSFKTLMLFKIMYEIKSKQRIVFDEQRQPLNELLSSTWNMKDAQIEGAMIAVQEFCLRKVSEIIQPRHEKRTDFSHQATLGR